MHIKSGHELNLNYCKENSACTKCDTPHPLDYVFFNGFY